MTKVYIVKNIKTGEIIEVDKRKNRAHDTAYDLNRKEQCIKYKVIVEVHRVNR